MDSTKQITMYTACGHIETVSNLDEFGPAPDGALALHFSDAEEEGGWITDATELARLERENAPLSYTQRGLLAFHGWGIAGDPKPGVIVAGPSGPSIDVTGYGDGYYWTDGEFAGPDEYGIVPIYRTRDGQQFPADAKQYPCLA